MKKLDGQGGLAFAGPWPNQLEQSPLRSLCSLSYTFLKGAVLAWQLIDGRRGEHENGPVQLVPQRLHRHLQCEDGGQMFSQLTAEVDITITAPDALRWESSSPQEAV